MVGSTASARDGVGIPVEARSPNSVEAAIVPPSTRDGDGSRPGLSGSAGAIEAVELTWRNVNYSVDLGKKGKKEILCDQAGQVKPGQILSIMGPSGSGKTSLLNVLAGRVLYLKKADLTGHVLVNGLPKEERDFKRCTAYVMQDDALYAFLTVRETIMLAAHFQLPSSLTTADKEAHVTRVVQELGLSKAQNTIIGNERARGVSGGERRRVMIAVELIGNPSCLFLDEPTSGLDSFQAQSVVSALRDLAKAGRSVIVSIHQPRSSIFQMFDMLLLLSEGRAVYFGPASRVVDYFATVGFQCPPLWNAADWLLDLIAQDYRSPEAESSSKERIGLLQDEFREAIKRAAAAQRSRWRQQLGTSDGEAEALPPMALYDLPPMTPRSSAVTVPITPTVTGPPRPRKRPSAFLGLSPLASTKKSSWLQQFWHLAWRSGKDAARNVQLTIGKIGVSALLGLLLGLLYSHVGHGQQSISDRKGILFFVCINQAFGLIGMVTGAFPKERKVVERERMGNAYHISAYFLAKFFSELPFNLVGPFALGSVVYWIAGLNATWYRFLIFLFIILLESLAAVALGLAVSSAAPSTEVAGVVANVMGVIMLLCGGFYISIESLPPSARWVADASLMKWAFQGLVINEFEGATLTCTATDRKCVTTGREAIREIGFGGMSLGGAISGLLMLIGIFNFIAYLLLRFNKPHFQVMKPPPAAQAPATPPRPTAAEGSDSTAAVRG